MNDLVPLLKHTPSAQRPEVLEAITVQREPLIAALVESALDVEGGLRHHLLVGPRGIGKTHILSLVANRVRAADPDANAVVVAWLHEDPWAIRTYDKFLASIATRVAAATGDRDLAGDAGALRAGDSGGDDAHGEELLRRAVAARRLVVLVENLDEIFRRIGPDGQLRFRAFAEDWGQMLLLATTPQLFAGVRQHESPFYGFFAVTHLDELSLDSAEDLLRRIARLRGDEALLRFLGTPVARQRLTAIEALAGGHPRVWLLLAGCISVAAIDELVPLFLEALDDLTPYYQDRLRDLGDQQQEIVVLLSEAGGALSNGALSQRSGISERQVATILRQLADRGYVRRAELPDDLRSGDRRMSFWELREPLMRLCLDVKQARGEPLRIVVEFLRAWYGPRLLDELDRLPPTAELANLYASEAFRSLDLSLWGEDLLRGTPEEVLARTERGLALRPDDERLRIAKATALMQQQRFHEAREMLERLIAGASEGLVRVGLELMLAQVKRRLGEPFDHEALVARALDVERQEPDAPAAVALSAFVLDLAGRYEEAVEAYDRAIQLEPDEARLFHPLGSALARIGRDEDALRAFERALEIVADDASVHVLRGTMLSRLGRYDDAVEAFSRAVELDPEGSRAHGKLGAALFATGRFEEALDAFERAVEGDPARADLRGMLAATFHVLGRHEGALAAYAEAARLAPEEPLHLNGVANSALRLGRFVEAEEAARRAVALDGEMLVYRFTLAEAVLASGDSRRALDLLEEALTIWSDRRADPPGDTEVLCRIVWERFRHDDATRADVIERLVAAYRGVGALEQLGSGSVATIPRLFEDDVAQVEFDAWVEAWARAPLPEDDVAIQMLKAAQAWKRDRDQKHLLALPHEQREILVGLLPR